jgi:hypothetical protein
MNILPIYSEDNVGDSLAKINYNFLLLNSENCSIQENKKQTDVFLNNLEKLMDDLDEFLPKVNYDYLEQLESTVFLLSSYWNKFEFTVQYPFNPTNGYTTALVGAGELGNLESSDNRNTQINILAKALVTKNLYSNIDDAKSALNNKDIVYVKRNSNGDYLSWDYLDNLNLFNFSVDIESNFYFDDVLVDVYAFPHFSVIVPSSLNLAQEELSVDFDEKIVTLKGIKQNPNKKVNGLIESNLVIYSLSSQEELDELGDIIDVTRFEPSSKRLNQYISFTNNVFKQNFKKTQDTFLESSLSNPKLNQICLDYLNQNYSPSKFLDNTIVNIIFFLYNTNGYNQYAANVITNYFGDERLSNPERKIDYFKSVNNSLDLKAPSSNTQFNITFSKQNILIEKMVVVKYVKKTRLLFIPVANSDTPKIKQDPYWEFISANLGSPYKKGVVEFIENLDEAPKYIGSSVTTSIPNVVGKIPTEFRTIDNSILETKAKDTFELK